MQAIFGMMLLNELQENEARISSRYKKNNVFNISRRNVPSKYMFSYNNKDVIKAYHDGNNITIETIMIKTIKRRYFKSKKVIEETTINSADELKEFIQNIKTKKLNNYYRCSIKTNFGYYFVMLRKNGLKDLQRII